MQEKFIQDISQIYEICTSNSYQYMAYWRRGKLFLQLRDFINNREIPMSLSETVSDISDVKFSPDDRLLAVMQMVNETGYQYCLSVFDTRSGKELMHRGLKTYITSFVFAKDGQNIIYKDESSDCTYLLHLGIKPTDVTP
ncbi:MAG TPA: hypothetical protein PKK33_10615, partial [Candidatus Cloacimonadota bacterium]|nr:hypothetical protein [Candidatus Cloacimonadota bacterium]